MKIYRDTNRTIQERVDDLLSRMDLGQKIGQLQCMMVPGGDPSAILGMFPMALGEIAIFGGGRTAKETMETNRKIVALSLEKPLGIPPIIHIEALTGLVGPETTVFPSAIGLGATFSPETVEKMGVTIRGQMLASGFRQALSPVLDVARDPRWGRIGETYGEDPTHVSEMGVAFVKGLQGDNLEEGIVTTGKHFLGYSLSDGGLNMASSPLPARDLREVYAKPFQAAISEAGMQSIMNTYGTIDNELVIASGAIMNDLLREEMGFDGVMVSDYMSIQRIPDHRLAAGADEAGVMALMAGLDVECPFPYGFKGNLAQAVQEGRLDMAFIDRAVRRVLETKFKLGLFENPYPFDDRTEEAYQNPVHRETSLKAARESIVLLKNDGVLPIDKGVKRIAVVGPHADSLRMQFGCYTYPASVEMDLGRAKGEMAGLGGAGGGQQAPDDGFVQSEPMPGSEVLREHTLVTAAMEDMLRGKTPTLLEAVRAKCPAAKVDYAQGCEVAGHSREGFAEALSMASEADIVIVTVGGKYGWGKNCTIGEGIDCDQIGLPGIQEEFALAVLETGTPAILVHMDARPLSSEAIAEQYPAILEGWFPGTTGGEAISDVLFGDYNPAGRLPATAARNAGQIPIHIGQKIGNSYFTEGMGMLLARYCDGKKTPLYYFGEGMSYTTFAYDNLHVDAETTAEGMVTVTFDIRNIGNMDGDEVAQLYVSDLQASMVRPFMDYAGAKRIHLKAGETKTIRFTIRADQFAFMNQASEWVVEAGDMAVMVGGSSKDLPLQGRFSITGTAVIDPKKRGFYAVAEVV